MRRSFMLGLALASASTLVAGQAQATQFFNCAGGSSCVQTDENVLLTPAENVTLINGVTNKPTRR